MKEVGKVVSTVECRMTSTRLPGKVMMKACGKPLLELLVERLMCVSVIDEIVLATTINADDDPIEKLAETMGISCFRGSEHDVSGRVLNAVRSVGGRTVVGVTGDCPLIDPSIVSRVIQKYMESDCDYAINAEPQTYPVGMGTHVFDVSLLELADRESDHSDDREHVCWFVRRQPKRFRLISLAAPPELFWPELGLTLDEREDYELIKNIFQHFYYDNPRFGCLDIIRYLKKNPELVRINEHVKRRSEELIRCRRED